MGVLVFGGLCWIGWQTDGWMDGQIGGWRTGHKLANMVFGVFAFVGFHCFWSSGGDRFGEGNLCSKHGVST